MYNCCPRVLLSTFETRESRPNHSARCAVFLITDVGPRNEQVDHITKGAVAQKSNTMEHGYPGQCATRRKEAIYSCKAQPALIPKWIASRNTPIESVRHAKQESEKHLKQFLYIRAHPRKAKLSCFVFSAQTCTGHGLRCMSVSVRIRC